MIAAVRDYGLTGGDSRRAAELGLVEAEWFRPPIDAERLRALQVRTIKHAAGRIDGDARDFIPEDELGKLKWESRAYIAVLAGTAPWCVAIGSIVPALHIGLPTVYGAWLMVFFAVTQHAGLREDVLDHRFNSRTVYMNPLFRFLYSNMNYHVEHHIFPTVPYYALPALHAEIKEHLAPPTPSTVAAYRQILATLRRQQRDPSYDEARLDVPDLAGAAGGAL